MRKRRKKELPGFSVAADITWSELKEGALLNTGPGKLDSKETGIGGGISREKF